MKCNSLGNKCDRESDRKVKNLHFSRNNQMQVPTTKAQEWCNTHGNMQYFEISAKENIQVVPAFLAIAKAASIQKDQQEM